jgi:transposase-like protein
MPLDIMQAAAKEIANNGRGVRRVSKESSVSPQLLYKVKQNE